MLSAPFKTLSVPLAFLGVCQKASLRSVLSGTRYRCDDKVIIRWHFLGGAGRNRTLRQHDIVASCAIVPSPSLLLLIAFTRSLFHATASILVGIVAVESVPTCFARDKV